MQKIAVAANDDCTVAEEMDNPPSLVVYEVNDKEILSRTIRYFRKDIFEVLDDCDALVGKKCSDALKTQLDSKNMSAILTEEESADGAVGQLIKIDRSMEGQADQTCRH
jgi:hypothetical protein